MLLRLSNTTRLDKLPLVYLDKKSDLLRIAYGGMGV
jgi:hypothetical protein